MICRNAPKVPETKHGCTCTCCKQRNVPRYKCVIFVKKNYDFTNKYICDKLWNRYREKNNKEYICKECHNNLKHSVLRQDNSKVYNTSISSKHHNVL